MSVSKSATQWEVVRLFKEAVTSLDPARVGELYSEDLQASYNFLPEPLSKEQAVGMLEQTFKKVASLAYSDVEETQTTEGFVLEFTLNVRTVTGTEFSSRNCIVASINLDGKFERIREYLDSAAFARLDASPPKIANP